MRERRGDIKRTAEVKTEEIMKKIFHNNNEDKLPSSAGRCTT